MRVFYLFSDILIELKVILLSPLSCAVATLPHVLFRLADKELQRKSLEDSLNAERSSGASRETKMQV